MVVVFLGYYSPENYQLLLQTADDRKKLDDKWEDWLVNFIKAKTDLVRHFTVEEIHLDVKKMSEDFKARKIKNTSKSRAAYINEVGSAEHIQKTNN
ncbi:MAG: hypothetical protein JWQ09_2141 [Segetibacter sp.]|nr:hypothetical protein [Segetibacter sp.]